MTLTDTIYQKPSSYTFARAITPHDTTLIADGLCEGLYVGSGGDIVVLMIDDTTATFSGVPTGTIIPMRVKRVNSTNTTASNLLALY